MKYLTVKEYSKKWNISERTARNYCSSKKIKGAYQNGGCWFIGSKDNDNHTNYGILEDEPNYKNFIAKSFEIFTA